MSKIKSMITTAAKSFASVFCLVSVVLLAPSAQAATVTCTRTELKDGQSTNLVAGTTYTAPSTEELGGVFCLEKGATLTGTNVVFKDNEAGSGGAIYNQGTVALKDATFTGNKVTGGGGAIVNSSTLSLDNVTFEGNTAQTRGGAINNAPVTVNLDGPVTLKTDSDTIYNTGTLNWNLAGGKQVILNGYQNVTNSPSYGKLQLTIDDAIVAPTNIVLATGNFSNIKAMSTETFTITNVLGGAALGIATINGSAVPSEDKWTGYQLVTEEAGTTTNLVLNVIQYTCKRTELKSGESINLVEGVYTAAPTTKSGGAFKVNGGATLTGTNVTFEANEADDSLGGAIANSGGTVSLKDATFKGNKAWSAGALNNMNGLVNLDGVTFDGNKAYYGGAITSCGLINLDGPVTLVTASDTIDLMPGDGVQANEWYWDSVLNWNLAGGKAGQLNGYDKLINEAGVLKLTIADYATPTNFVIATGDFTDVSGKDTFTITNVTGGAAITIKINGSLVGNEEGTVGYKLVTEKAGETTNLVLQVYELTAREEITGNKVLKEGKTYTAAPATEYGGVFCVNEGATLTGANVTFLANEATKRGGAIQNDGTVALKDATFTGNKVAGNGGAIYNSGTLSLDGVTFEGNTAPPAGGAIFNTGTAHFDGAVTLVTDSDTISNFRGTLNWNLAGGKQGVLNGYDKLSNAQSGTLQLTVEDYAANSTNFVIATGDFTDVSGKDTFTITNVTSGVTGVVKIEGDSAFVGGRLYTLSLVSGNANANQLVLTVVKPDMTHVLVNSKWEGLYRFGEEIPDLPGYYFGINAFANVPSSAALTDTTTLEIKGGSASVSETVTLKYPATLVLDDGAKLSLLGEGTALKGLSPVWAIRGDGTICLDKSATKYDINSYAILVARGSTVTFVRASVTDDMKGEEGKFNLVATSAQPASVDDKTTVITENLTEGSAKGLILRADDAKSLVAAGTITATNDNQTLYLVKTSAADMAVDGKVTGFKTVDIRNGNPEGEMTIARSIVATRSVKADNAGNLAAKMLAGRVVTVTNRTTGVITDTVLQAYGLNQAEDYTPTVTLYGEAGSVCTNVGIEAGYTANPDYISGNDQSGKIFLDGVNAFSGTAVMGAKRTDITAGSTLNLDGVVLYATNLVNFGTLNWNLPCGTSTLKETTLWDRGTLRVTVGEFTGRASYLLATNLLASVTGEKFAVTNSVAGGKEIKLKVGNPFFTATKDEKFAYRLSTATTGKDVLFEAIQPVCRLVSKDKKSITYFATIDAAAQELSDKREKGSELWRDATLTILADSATATSAAFNYGTQVTIDLNGATVTNRLTTVGSPSYVTVTNSVVGKGGIVNDGFVFAAGGTLDMSALTWGAGGFIPGTSGKLFIAQGSTIKMGSTDGKTPNWMAANKPDFLELCETGAILYIGETKYVKQANGIWTTEDAVVAATVKGQYSPEFGGGELTYNALYTTLDAAVRNVVSNGTVTALKPLTNETYVTLSDFTFATDGKEVTLKGTLNWNLTGGHTGLLTGYQNVTNDNGTLKLTVESSYDATTNFTIAAGDFTGTAAKGTDTFTITDTRYNAEKPITIGGEPVVIAGHAYTLTTVEDATAATTNLVLTATKPDMTHVIVNSKWEGLFQYGDTIPGLPAGYYYGINACSAVPSAAALTDTTTLEIKGGVAQIGSTVTLKHPATLVLDDGAKLSLLGEGTALKGLGPVWAIRGDGTICLDKSATKYDINSYAILVARGSTVTFVRASVTDDMKTQFSGYDLVATSAQPASVDDKTTVITECLKANAVKGLILRANDTKSLVAAGGISATLPNQTLLLDQMGKGDMTVDGPVSTGFETVNIRNYFADREMTIAKPIMAMKDVQVFNAGNLTAKMLTGQTVIVTNRTTGVIAGTILQAYGFDTADYKYATVKLYGENGGVYSNVFVTAGYNPDPTYLFGNNGRGTIELEGTNTFSGKVAFGARIGGERADKTTDGLIRIAGADATFAYPLYQRRQPIEISGVSNISSNNLGTVIVTAPIALKDGTVLGGRTRLMAEGFGYTLEGTVTLTNGAEIAYMGVLDREFGIVVPTDATLKLNGSKITSDSMAVMGTLDVESGKNALEFMGPIDRLVMFVNMGTVNLAGGELTYPSFANQGKLNWNLVRGTTTLDWKNVENEGGTFQATVGDVTSGTSYVLAKNVSAFGDTLTITNSVAGGAAKTVKVGNLTEVAGQFWRLDCGWGELVLRAVDSAKLSNVPVQGATAVIRAGGYEITAGPEGIYTVPQGVALEIVYTADATGMIGPGWTQKTVTFGPLAGDATLPDEAKPVVEDRWAASRTIAFDTRERIIVTNVYDVLPIAYSTNNWGEVTANQVSVSCRRDGEISPTTLVETNENGYVEWLPTYEKYGKYFLGQAWLNGGMPVDVTNVTVYYSKPYTLTLAEEKHGTYTATTVAGKAIESGDEVLGYDWVKLAATPEKHYMLKRWMSMGGGTFTNEQTAVTRFEMPNANAKVIPMFLWQTQFVENVTVAKGEEWEVFEHDNYKAGLHNYGTVIWKPDTTNQYGYASRLDDFGQFQNYGAVMQIRFDNTLKGGSYKIAGNAYMATDLTFEITNGIETNTCKVVKEEDLSTTPWTYVGPKAFKLYVKDVPADGFAANDLVLLVDGGKLTITYKSLAGFFEGGIDATNIVTAVDGGYKFPKTPWRDGYEFAGWYLGWEPGAEQVTEGTAITIPTNHALYAQWTSKDPTGKDGRLVMSDYDGTEPVQTIAANEYLFKQGLYGLVTPTYLARVESGAFCWCTDLRWVFFTQPRNPKNPDEKTRLYIGPSAFTGTAIETVIIPDGAIIDANAFQRCPNLKRIVFQGNGKVDCDVTAFRQSGAKELIVYMTLEFAENNKELGEAFEEAKFIYSGKDVWHFYDISPVLYIGQITPLRDFNPAPGRKMRLDVPVVTMIPDTYPEPSIQILHAKSPKGPWTVLEDMEVLRTEKDRFEVEVVCPKSRMHFFKARSLGF